MPLSDSNNAKASLLVPSQPPRLTVSKLSWHITATMLLFGLHTTAQAQLTYSDMNGQNRDNVSINAPTYPYANPNATRTTESRSVRIKDDQASGTGTVTSNRSDTFGVNTANSAAGYSAVSYPSYPTPTPYPNPDRYPSSVGNLQTGYPQLGEQPNFQGLSGDSQMTTSTAGIELFEQAKAAGDRGDTTALYSYEQQMSGGLFAMYPTYWRLNNNLSTLNPSVVTQFGQQYAGSVMAEKLVADYAETKAQSGDYAAVRQVAGLISNADASEACAVGLGFNQTDPMRTISLKDKVWLATKKQPALCDQLASEMANNRMITRTDKEQRLYRMLREGQTGDIITLANQLGVPISYNELAEIQLSPNAFLTRFSSQPPSQKNQYLYLYAIGRIADKSYREADTQLGFNIRGDNATARRLLDDATRRHAYRTLGVKRMNMNTDDGFNDEAVTWFRNSLGETFNFEEAEDYAQAGIRFSQWQDVLTAISAMNSEQQQAPIWRYWRARAYEQIGDASQKRQARQIYQQLAQSNDYYGLLAKDKIGERFSVGGSGVMPSVPSSDMARMRQDPHFARAFAMHEAGVSPGFVNREWNWAVKKARDSGDNAKIIAAAKQANNIGWLDRSIYAMENSDAINYALSHPMPYQNQVVRYSNQAGIDPAWAYGIMRQESRFQTNARSGVGASGLMQIMPGTAKYIARNLGESYSQSRANSGDTNIRYGTWYMSDVMSGLGYQPVLATAGYNAGPNKAKRWQPVYGSLPADQYVESIAYPETRNYVKHVMENATIYSDLLGETTPIGQRMGTIPPSF